MSIRNISSELRVNQPHLSPPVKTENSSWVPSCLRSVGLWLQGVLSSIFVGKWFSHSSEPARTLAPSQAIKSVRTGTPTAQITLAPNGMLVNTQRNEKVEDIARILRKNRPPLNPCQEKLLRGLIYDALHHESFAALTLEEDFNPAPFWSDVYRTARKYQGSENNLNRTRARLSERFSMRLDHELLLRKQVRSKEREKTVMKSIAHYNPEARKQFLKSYHPTITRGLEELIQEHDPDHQLYKRLIFASNTWKGTSAKNVAETLRTQYMFFLKDKSSDSSEMRAPREDLLFKDSQNICTKISPETFSVSELERSGWLLTHHEDIIHGMPENLLAKDPNGLILRSLLTEKDHWSAQSSESMIKKLRVAYTKKLNDFVLVDLQNEICDRPTQPVEKNPSTTPEQILEYLRQNS
jgi:hypothetical protein